jgi:hypothetical protein
MLKAARDAISRHADGRTLNSVRLSGSYWTSQGVYGGYTKDAEMPMELRIGLPDRFLRLELEEFGSDVTEYRLGFLGPRTISERFDRPNTRPDTPALARRTAAELLLGILGRAEAWGGLRLEADGPTAMAVRGPDGYAARVEFDPATHLPRTLTYKERRQVREPNTIRRRAAASASTRGGGSGSAGTRDVPIVDVIVTFQDHRDVGGFALPHRITWTASGVALWEHRFRDIQVNPALTDADFGG